MFFEFFLVKHLFFLGKWEEGLTNALLLLIFSERCPEERERGW